MRDNDYVIGVRTIVSPVLAVSEFFHLPLSLQTLLKTEILKNQLQIATISQTQPPTSSPLHNALPDSQGGHSMGGSGGNFNFTPSVGRPRGGSVGGGSPRFV